MWRSYSCSVFHDKPTVAVQMVHTALYQGVSWCNCKHREFETECAKQSYWGLWRRINLVSSHCVDGRYPGQCSHLLQFPSLGQAKMSEPETSEKILLRIQPGISFQPSTVQGGQCFPGHLLDWHAWDEKAKYSPQSLVLPHSCLISV